MSDHDLELGPMDPDQIQHTLNSYGFPCGPVDGIIGPQTTAAIRFFQAAYNNGEWLTVDGIAGPKTQLALWQLPLLSEHFVAGELACHHCRRCYVHRELLQALERLRAHLATRLRIVSAYRCSGHNQEVGGAPASMHLEGLAADLPPVARWETVAELGLFSGIGDRRGMVAHVDLRHLSAKNQTPQATISRPARWHYR